MRIVIDMQGGQSESRFRGIGRYSLALSLAMARNAGEHEIRLVLNAAFPESIEKIQQTFEGIVPQEHIHAFEVPLPVDEQNSGNAWRTRVAELIREYFIAQLNPDLILVTSLFEGYVDNAVTSIGRFFPGNRTVAILYDLIPYLEQEKYLREAKQRNFYLGKISSLKNARLLFSISEATRTEGLSVLGLKDNKIVNISSAVDKKFRPIPWTEKQKKQIFQKYNISREMVMYVPGGFDSRKNFDGLIKAYAMLPLQLRHTHQLVIVSNINDGDRVHLNLLAKRAGLKQDELVLTDYVPDEDLITLYNLAALFIFPSRHEGFGLPALEAMACGTPVIGSNTTSIPEVIGFQGALFDPDSPESIAGKIEAALTDHAFRAELVKKARKHIKTFSWDKSAERILDTLDALFRDTTCIAQDNWPEKLKNYKNNYSSLINKTGKLARTFDMAEQEIAGIANIIAMNEEKLHLLLRKRTLPRKINWRLEGPFDSSYSLALLNRETAIALEDLGHNVILHSTEGPGDFDPDENFLNCNPGLRAMHEKVKNFPHEEADVVSRNLYPPRVNDMQGPLNLLHDYGWEETAFPQEWVADFNQSLQGITCLSKNVEKIMIDNGVTVPLRTSGCGVDYWERITADNDYKLDDDHGFRFLHVSSCFPRKGMDILLESYGQAFSNADDIVLIIKTFPNPHNKIYQWLDEAKQNKKGYPDVIIIEDDMPESQIKALYQQCDALVGPSRGEGFGLPFAEAMLSELPVITTGWGGQIDFCTSETAWLIDYKFMPAQTHFELFNSAWAEPSSEHLALLMRQVYELPETERKEKARRGRKFILEKFKWSDVASRLVAAANDFSAREQAPGCRIGWITTWNTRCGIASYSKHLINNIYKDVAILAGNAGELISEDEKNVHRCWFPGKDDDLVNLDKTINRLRLNTIVVQFNYGFFNFKSLIKFLDEQAAKKRTIVVMLHATKDPGHARHKRLEDLVPGFKKCDRLLVHSHDDLTRLKAYGLVENVTLFPHGIPDWSSPYSKKTNNVFTIASYGFFLPHKGLLELLEAVDILVQKGVNLKLKMLNAEYPAPESKTLIQEAGIKIKSSGLSDYIQMDTRFLSDTDSLFQLAEADLIVFPYQNTEESSSAAVRYGLVTGKPVAVTPLAIFDDVAGIVFKLPGTDANKIAEGIEYLMAEIINDSFQIKKNKINADKWRAAHRYSSLGTRLTNMLIALGNQKLQ